MANRIQFRRGTAQEAINANPVLAEGEFAYETDTEQFKIGNGTDAYVDLPYGGIAGPVGPAGADGADSTVPGPEGPQGLPGYTISEWLVGSTYNANELVVEGNQAWISQQGSNTGNQPSLDDGTWWVSLVAAETYPIGGLMPYPASAIPTGWLRANGQLYNIVDYPELFAVYGTTYGGDGVLTFGVPNLDGLGVIGIGTQTGASGQTYGDGTAAVGDEIEDQGQLLTGDFFQRWNNEAGWYIPTTEGVFKQGNPKPNSRITGADGSWNNTYSLGFDSSGSPDARTGDHTRGPGMAVVWCVKARFTQPVDYNDPHFESRLTDFENRLTEESKVFHIQHTRPINVPSGTITAGFWNTSTLNTLKYNTITGASLDTVNNQFTLPAGKYHIRGFSSQFYTNAISTRLHNVTDDTVALIGANGYNDIGEGYNTTQKPIQGIIEITSPKTFELQAQPESTRTNDGWGFSTTSIGGLDRVWADLFIEAIDGTAIVGPEGPQGVQGPPGDNYWEGSARFISSAEPTAGDGVDGDFWFKVAP